MPVNLPEPVGPKLFILGEPVLHRYYTVYNWHDLRVGFSLANNHRNIASQDSQLASRTQSLRGSTMKDDDKLYFMQQSFNIHQHDEDEDQVLFVQVTICVNIRSV